MLRHFTILNPHAGRYSPSLHEEIAFHTTNREGLIGKVIAETNLSGLERKIQVHKERAYDILGIGGGDGTFGQTLNLVQKAWGSLPEYIAPYAIGTMNNVTRAIGVRKPLSVARYLGELKSEDDLDYRRLPLLRINDRYGFNVGFGLVPKLLWLYNGNSIKEYVELQEKLFSSSENINPLNREKRDVPGILRSLKTAIIGIAGGTSLSPSAHRYFQEALDVEMEIDGRKHSFSASPTAILTSSYEEVYFGLPLTAKPLPKARERERKMCVLVASLTPREIVTSQFRKLFTGTELSKTTYHFAQEISLEFSQPVLAQIDGDLFTGRKFRISYDRELKFIVPA